MYAVYAAGPKASGPRPDAPQRKDARGETERRDQEHRDELEADQLVLDGRGERVVDEVQHSGPHTEFATRPAATDMQSTAKPRPTGGSGGAGCGPGPATEDSGRSARRRSGRVPVGVRIMTSWGCPQPVTG